MQLTPLEKEAGVVPDDPPCDLRGDIHDDFWKLVRFHKIIPGFLTGGISVHFEGLFEHKTPQQTDTDICFSFSWRNRTHFNFREKSSPNWVHIRPSANCGIEAPLLSCYKRASNMPSSSLFLTEKLCVWLCQTPNTPLDCKGVSGRVFGYWDVSWAVSECVSEGVSGALSESPKPLWAKLLGTCKLRNRDPIGTQIIWAKC